MSEIHFIVEKAPEGGFVARAMGADIFTEADSIECAMRCTVISICNRCLAISA